MTNKLTELTDRVLKEVIKNEVVLPSTYKEHFDAFAREMNIDVDYDMQISSAAEKQLEEANEIAKKTSCNLDNLEKTTVEAKDAIEHHDLDKLAVVTSEISNLKEEIGLIKAQLHMDSLTHVYNRKWLVESLLDDGMFTFSGVLIFIDLDKFKPINDVHGHVVGDKVLQYFSSFLKTNLNEMDVVRYAGDEFVVIHRNDDMETLFTRIKELQGELLSKKLKSINGELLYLSFSFGVAHFQKESSFKDVLEIADGLMYKNKRQKEGALN